MKSSFLDRIATELLEQSEDLASYTLIFPGKRPVIFFKRLLKEKGYQGFLPEFFTIDEFVQRVSGYRKIEGIALWLKAYEVYKESFEQELNEFLKWFPTLKKDWDDILKYEADEKEVLSYMAEEEKIKNWGENLGEPSEIQKRYLDFWKRQTVFLPKLREKLLSEGYATAGMIYQKAGELSQEFADQSEERFVFCGFNALTPIEETLIRQLLQWNKAQIFWDADIYYLNDKRQEAGEFLRRYENWSEFGDHRRFNWKDNRFKDHKSISVYEVPGNITQTELLKRRLNEIPPSEIKNTAVVLLDEKLLPATLRQLNAVESVNITMGYPIAHLQFSSAVGALFHLQKQLEKKKGSYYYKEVLDFILQVPTSKEDERVVESFEKEIKQYNLAYLSKTKISELLGSLSYFCLLEAESSGKSLLEKMISFCLDLKTLDLEDLIYENVSHFENAFRTLLNQLSFAKTDLQIETLEVLLSHLIQNEEIQFLGEPLEGLQLMGLLETRLLDFKNLILLSANEGSLPQGASQNSYLPFEVRKQFELPTYVENDSIFAYHFYRLIQHAERVELMYNSVGSGLSTGEKSRFITQLELESPHAISHYIVESPTIPVEQNLMKIEKTPAVLEKLEAWKQRVSASQFSSYLYDPIQFYQRYILKIREEDEIEEELSSRTFGSIVHGALEQLYTPFIGKNLTVEDLKGMLPLIEKHIDESIVKEKQQLESYKKGMNFIHKSIAMHSAKGVIEHDLRDVESGATLEILALEHRFEKHPFVFNEESGETVYFNGFIDRIEKRNGEVRVIDFKTTKAQKLEIDFKKRGEKEPSKDRLANKETTQALQLVIYLSYMQSQPEFNSQEVSAAIWPLIGSRKGAKPLRFKNEDLSFALHSLSHLIEEILNPEIPFLEPEPSNYDK